MDGENRTIPKVILDAIDRTPSKRATFANQDFGRAQLRELGPRDGSRKVDRFQISTRPDHHALFAVVLYLKRRYPTGTNPPRYRLPLRPLLPTVGHPPSAT